MISTVADTAEAATQMVTNKTKWHKNMNQMMTYMFFFWCQATPTEQKFRRREWWGQQ